ncbi:hypothetical protein BGX38DRAFT_336942 [Terfezia claveryi]|nr:hypothetical protein BGX38DRAFT_336942 [Terfezia claveryi]
MFLLRRSKTIIFLYVLHIMLRATRVLHSHFGAQTLNRSTKIIITRAPTPHLPSSQLLPNLLSLTVLITDDSLFQYSKRHPSISAPHTMDHNSQVTLAGGAKTLILESLVVPQGHDNDLLIAAREAFYVFFREVLPHAAGAILEPTPNGALRVQLHESGYACVAFESARGAIEFLETIQLDERCKACTAEEWENGINEWQWQEYSHNIKLDIAETEENIAKLEGIADATPNQLLWLDFDKKALDGLKEALTKWESITAKGIRLVQLDLDELDWPAEIKASILSALEDVVAKQPYMIDPDRQYALLYQHGKLAGGTFKYPELDVHLSRQREVSYYFVDPIGRRYRQCAVAAMTTEGYTKYFG